MATAARRRRALGAWWSRRTVRARITLLATVLVAVAVAAAGVLAVRLLGYVLLKTVDDGARSQAVQIAALVSRGQVPDPLPAFGGTAALQVVDGSGHVLAASAGGDRLVPLVPSAQLAAVRRGAVLDLPAARLAGADPIRVLGAAADRDGSPRTVLVAVSAEDVTHSVRLVAVAAGIGGPLSIVAFAVACWMLTGSALRPVDVLRRGATRITDAGSRQRLPVPPARDEVRALAETLNAMLDRLTAAAAAQQAFVADAAHELRSPVASLRVQLEVERDHPDPAAWPATVADLLTDLGRLERLVSDLLALARAEQGDARARSGLVDLAAVARAAAADPALVREGVYVEVLDAVEASAGSTASALVRGDPDALRGVITNLLANAVRHASSQVGVSVVRRSGGTRSDGSGPGVAGAGTGARAGGSTRTAPAGPAGPAADVVVLTVADDGPGIPAADRDRVFDRFTRLDPARGRDRGGAGLGLAIVARLVAAHGGTITLADARAPGLRADAHSPGSPADARAPGHPGPPDPDARTGSNARSGSAGPGLQVTVEFPAAPPAEGH